MREFWIGLVIFSVIAAALFEIIMAGNAPHFMDDEYREEMNKSKEGAVKDV